MAFVSASGALLQSQDNFGIPSNVFTVTLLCINKYQVFTNQFPMIVSQIHHGLGLVMSFSYSNACASTLN